MKFLLHDHRWLVAAPLLLLASACGGSDEEAGTAAADSVAAATQAPPAPAPTTAGNLTDGNIVAILAASGQSEIVPSQAVVDRVENAQVKQFAQHMITQHTALGDTVTWVAQQNGITPAPDTLSAKLDSVSSATVQQLQGLSGAELDRAFMQYMVSSHQGALDAVTSFVPMAQNPQLRTALESDVLPVVRAHLAQADSIVRALGSP
jgi:putative membrane protein